MTIAIVLYFVAFYIAKKGGEFWWTHIVVAIVAFLFDAYGTYLMWEIGVWEGIVDIFTIRFVHTSLSVLALLLFFVQAGLGVARKPKAHRWFAVKIFLPTWVVAYMSGFLMIFA